MFHNALSLLTSDNKRSNVRHRSSFKSELIFMRQCLYRKCGVSQGRAGTVSVSATIRVPASELLVQNFPKLLWVAGRFPRFHTHRAHSRCTLLVDLGEGEGGLHTHTHTHTHNDTPWLTKSSVCSFHVESTFFNGLRR